MDMEIAAIKAMQAGDRSAFEGFVDRQGRWVRGVLFGTVSDVHRVDDLLQEVWATVWTQVGKLREPNRWRSWLYRLAKNTAIDAGRKQTRERHGMDALLQAAPGEVRTAPSPIHALVSAEQQQMVLQAIRALPAIYREPFVLRHLEEWSYRRIAEVLDMPVDTVETRLVRGRRLLREALKDRL
jgi:RNA polymerase sigma-70 factor (ECF subfamily)